MLLCTNNVREHIQYIYKSNNDTGTSDKNNEANHKFWETVASLLVEARVPSFTVMKRIGHRQVEIDRSYQTPHCWYNNAQQHLNFGVFLDVSSIETPTKLNKLV